MTSPIGAALAFYIRHFDDAEALRELVDAPAGITNEEWRLVRTVVKHRADSEAAKLIRAVTRDGVRHAIRSANRVALGEYGDARLAVHWALSVSIGDTADGPERIHLGVAIDGDSKFGPWLGVFINYNRRRATSLRRAATVLSARKVAFHDPTNPDRGWTGQLVLERLPLRPDSTVDECTEWARTACAKVAGEMFDELAF